MRKLIVMLVLLACADSALAALEPNLYLDNINGNQYDARWTTVPGLNRFLLDASAWGGASNYNGGGGESLKLNAHVAPPNGPGGNCGIYNDLRDGTHNTDFLAANQLLAPAAGYPLTLETWFNTFSTWPAGDVDWAMTLSGDTHSITMGTGATSSPTDSDNLWYSIDGGAWTDTGILMTTTASNAWNNVRFTIRPTELVFGVPVGGFPGPLTILGDFSDFTFHTITVTSDAGDNERAGYLSQINVLGTAQNIITVPEPATLALLGLGLPVLLRRRRW